MDLSRNWPRAAAVTQMLDGTSWRLEVVDGDYYAALMWNQNDRAFLGEHADEVVGCVRLHHEPALTSRA